MQVILHLHKNIHFTGLHIMMYIYTKYLHIMCNTKMCSYYKYKWCVIPCQSCALRIIKNSILHCCDCITMLLYMSYRVYHYIKITESLWAVLQRLNKVAVIWSISWQDDVGVGTRRLNAEVVMASVLVLAGDNPKPALLSLKCHKHNQHQ